MPATKNQIKANRENSQKSTGPKTDEGKEIVAQNATTFGLFSKKLVIKSKYHIEDRVDYELLIEDLRSELNPQSFFQEYLIKKIANCLWRSQRVSLAETAHINKQLDTIDEKIKSENIRRDIKDLKPLDFSSTETDEFRNLVGVNSIPEDSFAKRILYYEMRLDKQLSRTYNMLRRLQHKEEAEKQKKENSPISKSKANSL